MSTIFKILAIIAVLIFAVRMSPKSQESPALSGGKQKLQPVAEEKAKENWQSVRVPVSNEDGTVYIYDKNSIAITRGAHGESSGAELTAKIIRGDESVLGKVVVLTFLCDGHFRVNQSYPFPVPSLSQEEYMQNIACGAVQCMMMKKEKSPLACSY